MGVAGRRNRKATRSTSTNEATGGDENQDSRRRVHRTTVRSRFTHEELVLERRNEGRFRLRILSNSVGSSCSYRHLWNVGERLCARARSMGRVQPRTHIDRATVFGAVWWLGR